MKTDDYIQYLINRDQAKKPTQKWKKRGYGKMIGDCPNCGATVEEKFCSECGQRIDWREE